MSTANFISRILQSFGLLLVFSVTLSHASQRMKSQNCDEALLAKVLRSQIYEVAKNYERTAPKGLRSTLNGTEFKVTGPVKGTHLLTLGPETDILQPLHSFPLIENIHMVDLFAGIDDKGPLGQVEEILNRLKSLSPNSKVKIIKSGFLNYFKKFPSRNLKELTIEFINIDTKPPAVLELQWPQTNGLVIKKYIYLHAMDYNNPMDVKSLSSKISSVEVLLISGASIPEVNTLYSFLDLVNINGWVVVDIYSRKRSKASPAWKRAFEGKFDFILAPEDVEYNRYLSRNKIRSETWVGRKIYR